MVKIGSPLFILMEECKKDLMGVLERLAEIGFDGVEFLGLFGHKPADIKKKLDSCGLKAIGDHVPFDEFVNNTEKVIAEHKEMGCSFITIASPAQDGLPGGKDYTKVIKAIETVGTAVNDAGMKLLFHNHASELRTMVDGKAILEHLADDIDSKLLFLEPDLGWMKIGGADPAYYLKKYRDRCPVVHFKDYAPSDNKDGFEFRPTGYGAMNNAELYAMILALDMRPAWFVMDHDCAYERDIYDDLTMSLCYFRNLTKVVK
jgi:sugar phosphate isomerase/epimerase